MLNVNTTEITIEDENREYLSRQMMLLILGSIVTLNGWKRRGIAQRCTCSGWKKEKL